MISRKNNVIVLMGAGIFALSLLQTPLAHGATCTTHALQGEYGISWSGTRIGGPNPGPRTGVGLLSSDGVSNLSGIFTKSSNGTITHGTLSGNYTMNQTTLPINETCTGSAMVVETDSDGTTKEPRNFVFVIIKAHHEFYGLQTDDGRATTIHGVHVLPPAESISPDPDQR